MDNTVDFHRDIYKYAKMINKQININSANITLNLFEFNDEGICDCLLKWELCLGILNKHNLIKTKHIFKIIYCIIYNCNIINNINGKIFDLDIYDDILERFLRLETVDELNRIVKLRVFTVCNVMIVIDCKDLNNYKIYEIYNIDSIKKYYGNSKINFDSFIKIMNLKPIYSGSLYNIKTDFGVLAHNLIEYNYKKFVDVLDNFIKHDINIEKQIMKEYNKIYSDLCNTFMSP